MVIKYGDSALDKPTADKLVERLEELRPRTVVEFGSGTSTYFLGKYAEKHDAKVVSLEHLEVYAKETRKLCEGLPVYIRRVDLVNGVYQTSLPGRIDFALIDGPPGWTSEIYPGRRNTFRELWPSLNETYEVWLDDANREHEKDCLRLWSEEFPIEVQLDTTGKGLAIITPSSK